ncbi:hypothetical protein MLD38_019193 [Melastoma candidum]|uniref:Uncharacterized protein n=1 Tax=Melastoma candidum TaxID=119954 RepID=A0ACB9R4H6_9MYRT|nr:hypothetical protein MLD38_019193 [Melastoma candidum]
MNQKLHLGGSILHGNHPNNYYANPLAPTALDSLLIPPPPATALPVIEAAFPSPLYLPTKEAADSSLTFNGNGKRCREDYGYSMMEAPGAVPQRPRSLFSLLDCEAAIQIQNQQRELNCLVAQHTQRLRTELEERARHRSKALVLAVREAVAATAREKDGEISRLSKLNWALQERVRGLSMENELWRGLAQSNEAAANSLRTDLERVLTSPGIVEDHKAPTDEDAESCCGSSGGASGDDDAAASTVMRRGCKGVCGGRNVAGVMVMPCRHLCLCTTCGSGSQQFCPVCGSAITASIHVNFSSSS